MLNDRLLVERVPSTMHLPFRAAIRKLAQWRTAVNRRDIAKVIAHHAEQLLEIFQPEMFD